MESIKSATSSEGFASNEWEIHQEVIGEPSHGHVLGMGAGLKAKDMFGHSSSQSYNKHYEALTDRIKQLEVGYT